MNCDFVSVGTTAASFVAGSTGSQFVQRLDEAGQILNASYKTLGLLQLIWSEGMGEGISETGYNIKYK
ncbi:hypothetical protein CRI94_01600 [Longibacter salinarum]|uniref:Uncharacterized protein n=1 Tax=Longibacter salinarum TaxID=1850348 RepID=A0A2A8D231_9BACT|nr:hypothetical protein CRI94_01600 [Longibacter salinarum]